VALARTHFLSLGLSSSPPSQIDRDVEILVTLQKLANWHRLEKMVRELHLGTRLTKGTLLSTKLHYLFFTSQYLILPSQCRKEAPTEEAGPSQAKKKIVQKKGTHQEAEEGYNQPT
jgi:hypothetical protein